MKTNVPLALIQKLREVPHFTGLTAEGANIHRATEFCAYIRDKYHKLWLDRRYKRSWAADLLGAFSSFVDSFKHKEYYNDILIKSIVSASHFFLMTERVNDEGVTVYGPFLRWLDTTDDDSDAAIALKCACAGKVANFIVDDYWLKYDRERVNRRIAVCREWRWFDGRPTTVVEQDIRMFIDVDTRPKRWARSQERKRAMFGALYDGRPFQEDPVDTTLRRWLVEKPHVKEFLALRRAGDEVAMLEWAQRECRVILAFYPKKYIMWN